MLAQLAYSRFMTATYSPRRLAQSRFVPVRGLQYHVNVWGDVSLVTPERPALVMVHGWMDVGASFQFVVDELAQDRYVIAPDWRGFGLSETPPATDGYSAARIEEEVVVTDKGHTVISLFPAEELPIAARY